ncbi:hypothetical protein ACFLR2_00260 [Chlamydiota bacterium]
MSVASSSSSSSENLSPRLSASKLLPQASPGTYKKLDCLRMTSSAFMIAVFVTLAVTTVLIGLSQARYISALTPLFAFSAIVPLFVVTIALDYHLHSVARKNGIDPVEYFRVRQPPPKKPKAEKKP